MRLFRQDTFMLGLHEVIPVLTRLKLDQIQSKRLFRLEGWYIPVIYFHRSFNCR